MSKHTRPSSPTVERTRAGVRLTGRRASRLIAVLLVLIGVYPLVKGPVDGFFTSEADGLVTAAQQGKGHAHRHGHHHDDDDDDDDEDVAETRVSKTARASDAAKARAEAIASGTTSKATTATTKGSTAGSATSGSTSGGTSGSSTSGSSSATAAAAGTSAGSPIVGPPPPIRPSGTKLAWAPPAGYQSFPVRQVTGSSFTSIDAKGGDVRIELPAGQAVGPITIKNCRNAVLIGGRINVLPTATVDGQDQRAIYVRGCTGIVHIEGVLINGAVSGSQSDGIAVSAPDAVLQIENVRVEGILGGKSGNHADVFQPWGGVKEFRIDRLTGSSNYQGLHIGVGLGPIGRGHIRNANIIGTEALVDKGGQFIWMDCNAYPLTLENVFISGRSDRGFEHSIWPQAGNSGCPAVISGGVASWPQYAQLSGSVHDGRPSAGDFVPAGSVGLGYTGPGYL